LSDIIVIKKKKMRLVGHAAQVGAEEKCLQHSDRET